MSADLIKRLGRLADSMDVGGLIASRTGTDNEVCPDACDEYAFVLRQAADALASQAAENASLRAMLAEAEAALEPFAALAGAISEGMTVSVLAADGSIINLSFEHFETAARALAAIRAQKDAPDA